MAEPQSDLAAAADPGVVADPAAVADQGAASTLLLVTGPGRSGTSAITGALSQLGVHVPPPLVGWNKSNQRGFYETRWVVDFQKRVLAKAHTYEFDSDPVAISRIGEVADEKLQAELTQWLGGAVSGRQQAVIKDPRSVWLNELWVDAAKANGLEISYLTMLRHPTEVVGSRSEYYGTPSQKRESRDYAISKVAGWINVSLLNERQTRGRRRVYLRYTDLLADWRTALGRVRDGIGLEFNASLAPGESNPVDDFISPELHRIKTSWAELDVPAELRQLADEVWAACERLADEGGDADLGEVFDALSERYFRMYRDAAAIAFDTRSWAVATERAEWRRKLRRANRKLTTTEEALAAARKPAGRPGRVTRFGRRVVRGVRRRIGR